MTLTQRILLAFLIGVSLTLLLVWLSFEANEYGYEDLSSILFWQNTMLQSRVPLLDIGRPGHPFHEGTPLVFLAFFLSFPIGFVVYGVGAFVVMSKLLATGNGTPPCVMLSSRSYGSVAPLLHESFQVR